ncbi:hypothetical protein F4677DRAFT_313675 [Hypoxylon crocopeplum]|nr:hypothetical protein F4677DRAFT_313675 [Hypoxylon crocopeplum]
MKFRNSVLILLSGFLSQSNIALSEDPPLPPLPPWYPLKPWEVSSFHASNPQDSPYSANATSLELTIANPSWIPAGPAPHASGGGYVVFQNSTASCVLHWKEDAETPYGNLKGTCDSPQTDATRSEWNITINQIHDEPAHYMDLSFSLAYHMYVYGTDMYKMMSGFLHVQLGENLDGGCDEDGLCSYSLKNGSTPLLVQPTLQECRSACG